MNIEERKEYNRKYKLKHEEKIREQQRQYRRKNFNKVQKWRENYSDRASEINRAWRLENLDKVRNSAIKYMQTPEGKRNIIARRMLNLAVKHGEIVRPAECSHCGKESSGIQAHHEDYGKPLEVCWLCRNCHSIVHTTSPTSEEGRNEENND